MSRATSELPFTRGFHVTANTSVAERGNGLITRLANALRLDRLARRPRI